MSDKRENPEAAGAAKKPCLRLIKSGAPTASADPAPAKAEEAAKPRPKSNLAKFMTAYADAIDCDIKIILDI